jgi:hypothetical protein
MQRGNSTPKEMLLDGFLTGLPDVFFRSKIAIWVNVGGPCNGKNYKDLVFFTAILYILWPFGIFCGKLV